MNLIDNFFAKIQTLPTLPKVVQEVNELIKAENADVKLIIEKINLDQVLAARVLHMANSAYFGCSRTVKTIGDAVAIIGLKKLSTLVTASAVISAFNAVPDLDLNRFWRYNLITASVARALSAAQRQDADIVYIAALMHSIGQLPIHMVFASAGAQIEGLCRHKGALQRKAVELAILGIDHCSVGAQLARLWHFPEEIEHAVRYYAEPFHLQACAMAPIIYAGVHIASGLEKGEDAAHIAQSLNSQVVKAIGMQDLENLVLHIEAYRGYVIEANQYV